MHPGEWYLIGDGERFSWAALILADGGRIYFDRVSEGTSWADARFRHTKTTSSFWDSTLEWSDSRWLMRFKDGSEAVFQACSPTGGNICSIVERRTADGHRILYRRDASGQLLAIESGAETIMLDYDQQRRIVEARHSNGERVMYTYDDEGRLSRVAASDGTIRTYTYGPRHEMLTIREPGWFIENWFDESGRCIRQTTYVDDRSEALTLTFSYSKNDRAGTQTNVVQYDGTRTRYQFDENGQTVSVTYDADSIAPLTASYDRNPATNHVEGLTITCVGPTGNVSRTVHASPIPANQLSSRMIRLACR
jgi:YD repeat-containing protein